MVFFPNENRFITMLIVATIISNIGLGTIGVFMAIIANCLAIHSALIDKSDERYQDTSLIEKSWRRLYYVIAFIKFIYYSCKGGLPIHDAIDGSVEYIKGKGLLHLLISDAQYHMKWSYSQDEMEEMFKKHIDDEK